MGLTGGRERTLKRRSRGRETDRRGGRERQKNRGQDKKKSKIGV